MGCYRGEVDRGHETDAGVQCSARSERDPDRVWALANRMLGSRIKHIFIECIKRGVSALQISSSFGRRISSDYRLICLLEKGKLFERVITNQLVEHLEKDDPDLHERQYGFRKHYECDTPSAGSHRAGGRSDVGAVNRHLQRSTPCPGTA